MQGGELPTQQSSQPESSSLFRVLQGDSHMNVRRQVARLCRNKAGVSPETIMGGAAVSCWVGEEE